MTFIRSFSAALAVVMLVVALPFAAVSDSDGQEVVLDGTDYEYLTHGVSYDEYSAEIVSVSSDSEVLYVSTTLEGYNVKDIDAGAFAGVTSKAIVIPERVLTIGDGAFDGCPSLERIYFMCDRPDMADGTVPEGVEALVLPGASGWGQEAPIQVVTETADGSSVDYAVVEGEAMAVSYHPAADGSVTVASEAGGMPVTSVAAYAFGASDKPDMTGPEPVVDVKSVKIQDGVQKIRERAFYYCTGLQSVEVPSSVTVIMDEAFRYCTSASDIDIPGSVTYIGFEAFRNCSSLKEVVIPDSVTFLGEGAFKIGGAVDVTVGRGVTEVPMYCFSDMYELRNVTFLGDVTDIGDWAFVRANSLEWAVLPDTVESIGDDAFHGCPELRNLDMGESLKEIGKSVFYDCGSLDGLFVPATVTSVGDNAFYRCTSLKDIYFLGPMPEFGEKVFYKDGPTVHCTEANAYSWSGYDGVVVGGIPDGPFPPADEPETDSSMLVYIAAAVVSVAVILAAVVLLRRRGN